MHLHRVLKHICFLLITVFMFMYAGLSYAQYPGFDTPGGRGGSGTGLVAVESNVDGGAIPIGASVQVVVLFRNEGGQPVQTGKINLYPSSNVSGSISLNQCAGEALPSGAECAIAITVKGLQAGAWRLEMLMLHSGRSRLVTTTISGTVEASGDSSDRLSSDIETIPDELDFGSLSAGKVMVEPVILRNITSNPIDVSDITINSPVGSGYSVETDCEKLDAGQACIATITWAPQKKGPSSGVLIVNHSGSTALASVALSGDYQPDEIDEAEIFPEAVPGKGLLVSSQTEVEFGDGVASASTITVSLVNVGDSPLALNDIKISGTDNGLTLANTGCAVGAVLQPIEACPLTLTWSPTRVGNLLDDVQVLHDGARGILVLPVRGEADSVVSQDQKAIVLTSASAQAPTKIIGATDVAAPRSTPRKAQNKSASVPAKPRNNAINAASALDGLKITSFSRTRAIVNGPSGSRLVFDKEPIMLGGIVWDVLIQSNGIEFANGADRVLLIFDRSLSSINRVSGQSSRSSSSSSSSSSNDDNAN